MTNEALEQENITEEEITEEETTPVEEYTGESHTETALEEQPEAQEVIPDKPKRDQFYIRTLKNWNGQINAGLINEIQNSNEYLAQLGELHSNVLDDDDLLAILKPHYSNINPIESHLDRHIAMKMLFQGNQEYLARIGYGAFSSLVESCKHVSLIRKNNQEIVGAFCLEHINKYCAHILIYVRGSKGLKGVVAKEMVNYFGKQSALSENKIPGYAEQIHQQGYTDVYAHTLNKTMASLVENVRNKECRIIVSKLKTEQPEAPEDEIKNKAKKLIPGFKWLGSGYRRKLGGEFVNESTWRYDLGAKFSG